MAKTFLDKDTGFLYKKRPGGKTLTIPLERDLVEPTYFTDEQLHAAKGDVVVFDLEIYPNYFLAAFKHYKTGLVATFELYHGTPVFDYQKLLWIMHNFCLVGFNSSKFDLPLIGLALQGGSIEQLEEATEKIIKFGAMPRDIEEFYKFKSGSYNHVDLIEVAPLSASLKAYGGRLHAARLQDLPYDPAKPITPEEAHKVKLYCINDLDLTALLLKELEPQLELRASMSREYNIDLRSKSDAQIAEAVICSELKRLSGYWPRRPKVSDDYKVKYIVPDFIKFDSPELKQIAEKLANAEFALDGLGSPMWPEGLGEKEKTKEGKDKWVLKTKIGNSIYKIGMGGLHSNEKNIAHFATEEIKLVDNDVESFYPKIILNQNLAPSHLEAHFIVVYNEIVQRRLEAKHRVKQIKKELAALRKMLTELP